MDPTILDDYEAKTGYPLARDWQKRNGRLAQGLRLVPTIPFVAGGEYAIENLHPMNAVAGMRFRGSIAFQIKDLPEGAKIKLKIVD